MKRENVRCKIRSLSLLLFAFGLTVTCTLTEHVDKTSAAHLDSFFPGLMLAL